METKTFSVVTSISTILTVTAATLSIIGIAIIGLYLGIIVLFLLALIPIASKFYAKKMISKCNVFQRKYYTTFTIINSLSILVVFAMTFVILVDRVFPVIPEIKEVFRITGPQNIIMKVVLVDQLHLQQFIDRLLVYGEPTTHLILSDLKKGT